MKRRGRPQIFSGPTIGVKLSALLGLKVNEVVIERKTTISEVVRTALEKEFADPPKPQRIPYR